MQKVRGFQSVGSLTSAMAILATVTLAATLFPGTAAAQQLPRLAGPPDQSNNQTEDQDQSAATLKVNVNVVQLF